MEEGSGISDIGGGFEEKVPVPAAVKLAIKLLTASWKSGFTEENDNPNASVCGFTNEMKLDVKITSVEFGVESENVAEFAPFPPVKVARDWNVPDNRLLIPITGVLAMMEKLPENPDSWTLPLLIEPVVVVVALIVRVAVSYP